MKKILKAITEYVVYTKNNKLSVDIRVNEECTEDVQIQVKGNQDIWMNTGEYCKYLQEIIEGIREIENIVIAERL